LWIVIACMVSTSPSRLVAKSSGPLVKVPVRWWHGDTDPLVPIAGVHAAVSRLQDGELTLRSGESHLGGFVKIDEVLEFVGSYL
jgi:pimeloyl-ACP methyl ester carboxylesterase